MAAAYRPLNRSRNEIRLLKILPPEGSSAPADDGLLDFSPDPIRCELQYESLDEIYESTSGMQSLQHAMLEILLQDQPSTREGEPETNPGLTTGLMRRGIAKVLSVNFDSHYEMDPRRREALRHVYDSDVKTMGSWLPSEIKGEPPTFKIWLDSWIWTSLSGSESHLEQQSRGYFALSYVWKSGPEGRSLLEPRYREMEKMVAAGGSSARQVLEESGDVPELLEQVFGGKEGVAANTTEIIVDGKPVFVGKNLEKALRTLREIPEVKNGTRVWVDALCINQNDIAEKNVEVKRMGEIYGKADRVISWLGEENQQSGLALEYMSTLGQVTQNMEHAAEISRSFYEHVHTDAVIRVAQLLQRTYWKRIWIAQEICMGGDKSIAICGARRFNMADILACGKILLQIELKDLVINRGLKLDESDNPETEELQLQDLRSGIVRLRTFRDAKIDSMNPNREVPLSNTLWFRIPSSSSATNSKDLIYGMMNLLPDQLKAQINVDYSESTQFVDVMTNFASAHISVTNYLHWILHRPHAPFLKFQEWPSWVPNLALPFSSAHWDWAFPHQSNACPNTEAEASFHRDPATGKHILTCRGFRLDTINQATRNLLLEQIDDISYKIRVVAGSIETDTTGQSYAMYENLQNMLYANRSRILPDRAAPMTAAELPPSVTEHKYRDIQGLKAALASCFDFLGVTFPSENHSIFDIPWNLYDDDNYGLDGNQLRISAFINVPAMFIVNGVREVFADLNLWGLSFKDLFPERLRDVDASSISIPTVRDRTATFGRLFTTCNGYVGVAIGSLVPGDEIFLLNGCPMPVILRQSRYCPGAYEFLGGVCIPGVMRGEAFAQLQGQGQIPQIIRIC